LSAGPSATRVTAGEAVTISGKLTCATVEAASGQEVTIYEHEAGTSSPTPALVGTATTSADGSYEFHSAALTVRSAFVVRSASAAHAARAVVLVFAQITLQSPAASGAVLAIAGGHASGASDRLRFSGAVKPASADRMIELKVREAGGDWRAVAFARTDAEGDYTLYHHFRYAGEVSVIAVAHGGHEQATRSAALTYTITQAQNPALTIQATALSPAPTTTTTTTGGGEGSSTPATSISGVALGAHDQNVVLLARPLGTSRFVPIASVRADGAGAYSFTVEPTATTLYKVRLGSARSTVIRIESA
jgi:hypothetical protein